MFEIVTFGRMKSFLNFHLVYKSFRFKILRPMQQKLEMILFWTNLIKFRVFLIFKGLNENFFDTICT